MVQLEEITIVRAPLDRCFDLARSVEVHLAGNVHFGEAAVALRGVTSGLLKIGNQVTWRAKHFGVWHHLTSKITASDRPVFFRDEMTRGPFRLMQHDHFFRPLPNGSTEMKDVFCFAAPIPFLGRVAELTFLRRYMRNLLRERNNVLRDIAETEQWREYLCES